MQKEKTVKYSRENIQINPVRSIFGTLC